MRFLGTGASIGVRRTNGFTTRAGHPLGPSKLHAIVPRNGQAMPTKEVLVVALCHELEVMRVGDREVR